MVKKENLLFIASIVWIIAGGNVLKIGIESYLPFFSIPYLLLSALIFYLFWTKVFYKLVQKHTYRILQYKEEKQWFIKFFDLKSFLIMFFMITGGILIRVFHLLPESFIAVFYSGLGSALLLAGIVFGFRYFNRQAIKIH